MEKDNPLTFFEALKNSQPIAFMASLSFVVAALVIRTGTEQTPIYNAAVTAAILFLIAFIVSLIRQTRFGRRPPNELGYIAFSTYFFLCLGIVYWIIIAYEFSKQLPSIGTFVGSLAIAFMGSSAVYGAVLSHQEQATKSTSKKIRELLLWMGGATFLFLFVLQILPSFGITSPDLIIPIWIISAIAGGSLVASTIIIAVEKRKSKPPGTNKT